MSIIINKPFKKCTSSRDQQALYLIDLSKQISFEKGTVIAKKSNNEQLETTCRDDEYWDRGPISARHCGTMLWNLHSCISLEMTLDKSLRIVNYSSNTVSSVSADGLSCAIIHSIGVAYAQEDCVEVRGCDVVGKNDKFAKMTANTIAFSSMQSGVVYVLDEAGVQTKISEKMTNLHHDISLNAFLKGSRCGRQYKKDAIDVIGESYYKLGKDKTQKWLSNGVRISYTKAGVLDIWRDEGKIRVSTDLHGTARISTPQVNMVALGGKQPHFLVRKDHLKVIYDGSQFITRNSRQAAGFDRDGLFKFFD